MHSILCSLTQYVETFVHTSLNFRVNRLHHGSGFRFNHIGAPVTKVRISGEQLLEAVPQHRRRSRLAHIYRRRACSKHYGTDPTYPLALLRLRRLQYSVCAAAMTNTDLESDGLFIMDFQVTSFWNHAYFWTGSPYFKQAERDINTYGLEHLPANSPARWFRWSPHRGRQLKPLDHAPNTGWCGDWVWDPDVNASYLSVWGCQPTTDYDSAEWRNESARILTRWVRDSAQTPAYCRELYGTEVFLSLPHTGLPFGRPGRWIRDLKLDGFMFDAPDSYIGAGNDALHWSYTPALIREAISGVIANVSEKRAAAFAEIYADPPLMDAFGFQVPSTACRPLTEWLKILLRHFHLSCTHSGPQQKLSRLEPVTTLTAHPWARKGEFADDKICPQHSGKSCAMNPRASAIGQGVGTANASLIETAMTGPGSVDDMAAQVRT